MTGPTNGTPPAEPAARTAAAAPAGRSLSRRELLRGAAFGGVALFLAACGSNAVPTGSTTAPPASATSSPPSPPASPVATASTPPPTASSSTAATPSAGLSLESKIARLIVVGFRGSRLDQTPWLTTALRTTGLGGVILFDRDQLTGAHRNVISPDQVRTLVNDLRAAAGARPIIVSVDQEGGLVTRLSPEHSFPPLASEADIGRGSATAAKTWAKTMATTLANAGMNLNFAPVVDLNVNPTSPAIGALDRSFSADPAVVVRMATIEIDALRAAGVRSTLKHFPGIGSSTTNTDFGVADVTKTWSRTELEPFRRLIAAGTADLVMAGHVVNGQLDPDRPASLSKAVVTDLLRGELGWAGVVVTDDLQAAAITRHFGRDDAVILALEAGNDLLLLANQQVYDKGVVDRVIGVVVAAVRSGRLPESRVDEAYGRVTSTFG
jgi:beta-N-acetylhexosaminidase